MVTGISAGSRGVGGGGSEAFSGTTAISSGSASCSLFSYASVPGTSPYDGSLSTSSTRVLGTGELTPGLVGADCASVN